MRPAVTRAATLAVAAVLAAGAASPAAAQRTRAGDKRAGDARAAASRTDDPRRAWQVDRGTEPSTGGTLVTALLAAATPPGAPFVMLALGCGTLPPGAPEANAPAPDARLILHAAPEATGTWPETPRNATTLDLGFDDAPATRAAHLVIRGDGTHHVTLATEDAARDVPAFVARLVASRTLTVRIRYAELAPATVRFRFPPHTADSLRAAFDRCRPLHAALAR